MGLSIIGNLVAHARPQDERTAVAKLSTQFAFETEQNVALGAPVICDVASRILDHPDPDLAKLARSPMRDTTFSFMLGHCNLRPISCAERQFIDFHDCGFLLSPAPVKELLFKKSDSAGIRVASSILRTPRRLRRFQR